MSLLTSVCALSSTATIFLFNFLLYFLFFKFNNMQCINFFDMSNMFRLKTVNIFSLINQSLITIITSLISHNLPSALLFLLSFSPLDSQTNKLSFQLFADTNYSFSHTWQGVPKDMRTKETCL